MKDLTSSIERLMKRLELLIRRLALVAGVATLSAVAFSPKAQAQTTNVDFTGSIPATCTINSTTNGTLALKSPSALVAWGGETKPQAHQEVSMLVVMQVQPSQSTLLLIMVLLLRYSLIYPIMQQYTTHLVISLLIMLVELPLALFRQDLLLITIIGLMGLLTIQVGRKC